MKYNVPFIKPSFPSSTELTNDYERIIESNWFTNFGPFEQEFRRQTAEYIGGGVESCTASSATDALGIATRVLFGRVEGKKNVLVPSFTFAAGPEVLIANGYTPVFIDINANLQPDIEQTRDYIKRNRDSTAGILLCNIFGTGNREIDQWDELAEEMGLPMVIDSAAGFGSEYFPGECVGTHGSCEIFSLHATKPFAVGEGGLITSRDPALIEACRAMSNFGFGKDRQIEYIGANAKLQELNCAIGIRQLGGFATRLESRRETLSRYKNAFDTLGYEYQVNDDLSTVAFVSALAPDTATAARLHRSLNETGIESRRYYAPLHEQRILARHCIQLSNLDNTNEVAGRIVSLPVHDYMNSDIIDQVGEVARGVAG